MEDLVVSEGSKFEKNGAKFRDRLDQFLNDPNLGGTNLYRYQIEAPLAVRQMIQNDPPDQTEPCLISSPTGSGKSGMTVMLPYVLDSKAVLVLTPSPIISDRNAEEFGYRADKKNCFFVDAGLFSPTKIELIKEFCENVQVVSRSSDITEKDMGNLVIVNVHKFSGKSKATLSLKFRDEVVVENVRQFFSKFDTLIVDEAHHFPAETWQQIVKEWKKSTPGVRKNLVFLTATPYKIEKGKKVHILHRNGGERRVAYTVNKEECIGRSIKKVEFDLNRSRHLNLAEDLLAVLGEQEKAEPRFKPQAMVLAKGREHVHEIVGQINHRAGHIIAVGICGHAETIKNGLDEFNAGAVQVAVTCKVGLEGYNNTAVSVCVIARKIVTGYVMFSQFVGRCMRIKRGLPKINGLEVADRSVGKVFSYRCYELENVKKFYDGMDEFVSTHNPDELTDDEQ